MKRNERERDYWRGLWVQAINHMPALKSTGNGQLAALARCLDMPLKGAKPTGLNNGQPKVWHHMASMHVRANRDRGSQPKCPERQRKLILIASAIGPHLVRLKLTRLGIADRYDFK